MVSVERSKPASFGEEATDPPKPGNRPAMGKLGETLLSGNGGMLSAMVTPALASGCPTPKQKRRGFASGSVAACTRYTLAFTGGGAVSCTPVATGAPVSLVPLPLAV